MKISIKNSLLFLSLLTFIIPRFWNVISLGSISIDFYKIHILFLFSFFILSLNKLRFNKYEFIIFIIFIADFISCFFSNDFSKSFFYLINDFLGGFIFFYYGLRSADFTSSKFAKNIIKIIIILCFSFSLIEFFTNYNLFETIARDFFGSKIFGEDGTSNFGKFLGRPVSLWVGTSIDLAQSILGLFFIQILIYFQNKTKLNYFLLILCVVIIILAQSKAVYGALIVFFILYNFLNSKKINQISLVFFTSTCFFMFVFLVPNNFILSTYNELSGFSSYNSSFTARILSLLTIFNEFDFNFFGQGYGVLSKAFFSESRYDLLGYLLEFIIFDVFYFAQKFVESGLIALLFYLWFYYQMSRKILAINDTFYKNLFISILISSFLALNSTGSVYSFFGHFFIYGYIIVFINTKFSRND